ncbi:hypothetical protein [Paraburkholderia youngii]|uniref:hypothetical protein n=1 Tax=Paraburkholderia youngii TaxID=2782701 RepID=UPI003D1C4873
MAHVATDSGAAAARNRPATMAAVARASGLYPTARQIWTRHPILEKVSNDISLHLGIKLPGQDGPLLQDCLRDAIASYQSAENANQDPMYAYVESLVNRATDIFSLSVTAEVEDGTVLWDPLAESYPEFEARHGDSLISFEKGGEEVVDEVKGESALLLGARLLPVYLARYLIRTVVHVNDNPRAA